MTEPARSRNDDTASSPWERNCAQWQHLGYPLRPGPADVAFVQNEVDRIAQARDRVNALLLGVTVELTSLAWPANSSLVAIDSSRAMIARSWRAPPGIESSAMEAFWDQLPLSQKSIDLALGDGSLSALPNANAVTSVLHQLATVLDHGGYLVTRVVVRPQIAETPGHVIDAMRTGTMGSFQVFKFRLLMALHGAGIDGVMLSAVYDAVCNANPDRAALARALGWPLDASNTIDAYRDSSWRYFFPRVSQFRELTAVEFLEVDCHEPTYELGRQCPTFVLRRR